MTQEIYTEVKNGLYDKLQGISSAAFLGGLMVIGIASQTDNIILMLEGFATSAAGLGYLIGTYTANNQYDRVQPEENIDKIIEPTDNTYTLKISPKE